MQRSFTKLMKLMRIRPEQSKNEIITSHSGLSLIGQAIQLSCLTDYLADIPFLKGIPHADILKSYLGLLSVGKTDFEAIDNYRGDLFFKEALEMKQLPSASRLRQRMDETANDYRVAIELANMHFLAEMKVTCSPLWTGHVPLDMDLFPQDNSKTQKEGVSRTYKGHDGYGTMGAYLGKEGWNLCTELKPGKENAQYEFLPILDHVLLKARCLTTQLLLLRLDAAHDAGYNRDYLAEQPACDYIIKWNPRKESAEQWFAYAKELGHWAEWEHPRQGKRIVTFTDYKAVTQDGETRFDRRVIRVVERTIDKKGQRLLIPEYELEGWWTSLDDANQIIIDLYADHATSEQFHSEIKTDLDLERLPSGKFATNQLVMAMGSLIYNVLRWIGLEGLIGEHAPIRHPAKRRRLRTVMQELINLAGKFYQRSRYWWLRFSKHCSAYLAFCIVNDRLRSAMG